MGNIWLPSNSLAARSARGAKLSSPLKKPAGPGWKPRADVAFVVTPELGIVSNLSGVFGEITFGASIDVSSHPFLGRTWKGENDNYSWVQLNQNAELSLKNWTFVLYGLVNTTNAIGGWLGNWNGVGNDLVIRGFNVVETHYTGDGGSYDGGDVCWYIPQLEPVVVVVRYNGSQVTALGTDCATQGMSVTPTGPLVVPTNAPLRVGYYSGSQKGFDGHFGGLVTLNRHVSDAEMDRFVADPDLSQFFEPANQAPFLISVPAGGGANASSGSSSRGAATATGAGTVQNVYSASGLASRQSAQALGAGTVANAYASTGTASRQSATATGAGVIQNLYIASGAASRQSALASGAGSVLEAGAGTGAAVREASQATGAGTVVNSYTATGISARSAAAAQGAGTVLNAYASSGAAARAAAIALGAGTAGEGATGSGLSAEQATQLAKLYMAHFHKRYRDPATGIITIYAADDVTPLFTFDSNSDLSEITPR